MTEEEWLSAIHSDALLRFIEPKVSDRKLYCYDIACARRIAPILIDPSSSHAVEVLERFAEGLCNAKDIAGLSWEVEGAAFSVEAGHAPYQHLAEQIPHSFLTELAANPTYVVESARRVLTSAAYFIDRIFSSVPCERRRRDRPITPDSSALFRPVWLVHEVFGNPFRTVKFRKDWRTDTAITLARTMYKAREFSAMPILADAIQDAGCDNEDVLNHCRDATLTHVRGCWVCDLVLGKS
jgi:hypothetical protein